MRQLAVGEGCYCIVCPNSSSSLSMVQVALHRCDRMSTAHLYCVCVATCGDSRSRLANWPMARRPKICSTTTAAPRGGMARKVLYCVCTTPYNRPFVGYLLRWIAIVEDGSEGPCKKRPLAKAARRETHNRVR